ncbi:uncharacterized protein CELE_Y105C5A.508 [Caenorhabditis elegans]|uniref:Uncharacterized protein n=1 Tax=Caenorhabditis elegans TaxID=6239 RepID=C5VUJ9_CAEEL|nr:Uncharacterized protein CELE_Y105C5A.508 [Caenorhabditis elegans]CAZ65536.2 Uncharacterized protein CELE_Y105C5A.508 [Caenorhabditis elegans]|eukprot:NP_001255872.2 Uncharacterized protein CELE_Y105C5A.508 [Caenorhabditis elegans]
MSSNQKIVTNLEDIKENGNQHSQNSPSNCEPPGTSSSQKTPKTPGNQLVTTTSSPTRPSNFIGKCLDSAKMHKEMAVRVNIESINCNELAAIYFSESSFRLQALLTDQFENAEVEISPTPTTSTNDINSTPKRPRPSVFKKDSHKYL